MQPVTRTGIYLVAAVAFAGVAWTTYHLSQPPEISGFEKVGQLFYPDPKDPDQPKFDDPNEATGLRVVDYNEPTGRANVFNVEYREGAWRIPSHYDYPAEGEDQLAKAATSVMAIRRGPLKSRRASEQARFGLIDPLDEENPSTRGRGTRITLYGEDDKELVDYIVGYEVEDNPSGEPLYYVRRADEPGEIYVAELDLEVSTDFIDWIEPDLLKLDPLKLVELHIDQRAEQSAGDLYSRVAELSRKSSSDDWQLKDIGPAEQLVENEVTGMTNALDDLKIVGVRPKPDVVTPDLKLKTQSQELLDLAMVEMASRGFQFLPSPKSGQPEFVANGGRLVAATNEGVVYNLYFGNRFSGTEEEIEIGKKAAADQEEPNEARPPGKTGESRYLYVWVSFDENQIPDKPKKPEKPLELDAENSDAETDPKPEEESSDESPESQDETTEPDSTTTDEDQADPELEKRRQQYEENLEDYQQALQEREKKIKEGQEQVDELNRRFADWYYVISADAYQDLRLDRAELVEAKDAEEESGTESESVGSPADPVSTPSETDPPGESTPPQESSADPASATERKTNGESNSPASEVREIPAPDLPEDEEE